MRGGRLIGRWGAVLVAVLALGACSDDPAPVGPGPSGSAAPSTEVSSSAPTPPLQDRTPEGAIAFTYYFIDVYNHAYATNDPTPLRSVSKPACVYCRSAVDDIDDLARDGSTISGYTVTLTGAASPPRDITDRTSVEGAIDQAPGKKVLPDGSSTNLPGVKGLRVTVALAWDADGWKIQGLDVQEGTGKPWQS